MFRVRSSSIQPVCLPVNISEELDWVGDDSQINESFERLTSDRRMDSGDISVDRVSVTNFEFRVLHS